MSSRGFQSLHRREANEYLPFQRVRDAKSLSQKELADLLLKEAVRRAQLISSGKSFWTDDSGTYFNRETKRPYKPHHKDEVRFVYTDSPTNVAVFGSEGSGKSVAGIIKTLERLRRGMSGAMASPDLPHLKKSLWPEFQRWCAWDSVIPEHRYMQQFGWSPREPMIMGFLSGATLQVGGLDNPIAWEGSNISFAYIDEARRLKESLGMKTLKGRIRIAGARGEPPQIYFTTTKPRSTEHWLYTYFGDIQMDEDGNPDDPFLDFKEDSSVINLHVRDNIENLSEGFVSQRAQGLDPEEVELLIENQWVDLNEQESYLPSIALWDSCKTQIEPLDSRTPVVLALDAAEISDTFAAVACSWHPTEKQNITCVRYCRVWNPNGKLLDFEKIEKEIEDFIKSHRVVILVYDRALISQMCRRLSRFVWAREFSQAGDRLVADKLLHDAIMARTIMHSGNDQILRKHLMNADKKVDPEGRKMRIIKRSQNLKIDAAVALSMAHDYAKRPKLNLGI